MFEKSDQSTSDISEILGGAIARFARFDDPSKALFEALKSDNIKKGLKEFKIADITKDMFNPDSKEFKDIDIYDFTHYLLMVNREPNENNPTLKRLIEAVKDMQKESEKGIKQKLEAQWGPNYSEFKNDGLGAINKLLETKKGFVAGAFYKEGLGDIDLVWGNKDYGLEHILKRREDQALNNGINETEAKEYAMSVVKTIPEVIEKGVKVERNGRMAIEYQNIRVGLKDNWKGEKLPNHWVITGYEKRSENSESLYTSPLITKGETLPLNSNKPNPTINALKKQEPLSEQANAKKLAKLESEKGIKQKLEAQWGPNYSEFKNDGLGAINKLLETKKGFVAGAFHKEGLGDIDLVWGNKDYGLEHILKRREKQAKNKGLSEQQAKEYALNIAKTIPEVIEKGVKVDNNGRMAIEYKNIRVGLNDDWYSEKLPNKWVISSYEIHNSENEPPSLLMAQLQEVGLGTPKLTEPNPTINALKKQEPLSEQANAKKLAKLESEKGIKKPKFEAPSEWGPNYSEFKNDGLGAINKLLETKKGFVAGAFHKEGLGDIDLVWGTPKTKDSNGYGLAHILERRISNEMKKGLSETEAKEYALNIVKSIPEVLEKGTKGTDDLGRVFVDYGNKRVGLNNEWKKEKLENHWVISSYELYDTEKQALRSTPQAITKEKAFNSLNSAEPNPTTNALKTQDPLSEQANAKKLAKLESEKGIKEASKTSAKESEKGIKERAFKVIEDKEAFLKDLNAIKPTPLPKAIDTESFLNAFNGVKNKENFIKHLKNKPDSAHRLAYLNLVEPTLKEPDITLIFKEQGKEVKKEYIKAFQGDPKTIYYFLVTQDNDDKLITGLRISENYLKAEIDKADIIHSFIPQDS